MTQSEINNIFNTSQGRIKFRIDDNHLIQLTEDLLLKNNYRWRGRNNGEKLSRISKFDHIFIYTNYNIDELDNLMFSTDDLSVTYPTIVVTHETYKLLYIHFNPIPDYTPKKIIREI